MIDPQAFRSETCRLLDGGQFGWREIGSGPPLVMLHGWSMSSAVFTEVALLLSNNFRVLCPELPGHGNSAPPPEFSLQGMAEPVQQWMAQLALPPVALLGWSFGGQVALQLALQFPQQVQRLLLVSSTPKFCQAPDWSHGLPSTQLRVLGRNLERSFEKSLEDFFRLQFSGEELGKERLQDILNFAVRPASPPELQIVKKVLTLLDSTDLREQLAAVRQPTHVFHGRLDQIIPHAAGHFLAEQIPNAVLTDSSDVGHAPFLSCPQALTCLWRAFLQ